DAELLGGVQQARARALARVVVLEADLAEAGERVAHVRLVVDGQPAAAARVDVGERGGGEASAPGGVEPRHVLNDTAFVRSVSRPCGGGAARGARPPGRIS